MKQSLTGQVIEKLKISILSGEYAPGDRLPTLREMTELYDVSRSVVNAAVVDLESNGYIKIVPTKWIEVADWKAEGNLSIVHHTKDVLVSRNMKHQSDNFHLNRELR